MPRSARAWLRRELAAWRADGLVDERAAGEIERRYGLERGDGTSGAVFAIYLVGSLLIGGGLLSFVAWNWDRLPDVAKLALGATALAAAYAAGYWSWKIDGRRPLFGHALVLLGSLLFGANIGIVSQVFQLDGDWMEAAGLWAAGAALAAWLMGSAPNGVLAAGLAFFWVIGKTEQGYALWAPFVPAAVLLPLAFRQRSALLFACVLFTAGATLAFAAGANEDELIFFSLVTFAGLLFAASYRLDLPAFAPICTTLAAVATVGLAYMFSFHDLAADLTVPTNASARAWGATVAPQGVGLARARGLTAAATPEEFRRRPVGAIGLAAVVLLTVGTFFPDPEVPLAILANLALCLFAGYGIASSVQSLERGPYWAGVALLLLVVVSRFIEFETGLLVKGLVFTACGVAVLWLGLSFEQRVRAREATRA